MKTLVLVTLSYPYGGLTEASFIEPEISALSNSFDRVIIAPSIRESDIRHQQFPKNVCVSDDLLLPKGLYPRVNALFSKRFKYVKALIKGCNALREAAFNAYVGMTEKGLLHLIKNNSIDIKTTVFYTFWFDFQTAALSEIQNAKFISRTHGYDLYDDGRGYISKFWREKSLQRMNAVYPVCDYGVEYLRTHYPKYASKIFTRRLGSRQPRGINPSSIGKEIVCLGCARLSPEKDVIRQVELLMQFAKENPHLAINYHHIGGGEMMDQLVSLKNNLPKNMELHIHGAIPNEDVHSFLSSTHIEFSLLLSKSEGLPISICESLSYGIPVIATAICGIPEALRSGGGITISAEGKFSEFSNAISTILADPQTFRRQARKNWEENFSASKLREDFAKELAALISDEENGEA